MCAATHYRRYRATEGRRGAAGSNCTVRARGSDTVTAVGAAGHLLLVLLVRLVLRARGSDTVTAVGAAGYLLLVLWYGSC